MLYQIGDFSKISRLSIKTLRYYHECNLLAPVQVDEESGYRYYDERCLERARAINELKALEFSLSEIKTILENYSDDEDIFDFMEKKSEEIKLKQKKYEEIQMKLSRFKKQREEARVSNSSGILIKNVPDMLIASIRFAGRYDEVGKEFGRLLKCCGKYISGKFFCLYYDKEYKEDNAEIEICVQVSKEINNDIVSSRILKGGRAVSTTYRGPYEEIGTAYKKLIDHINENGINEKVPSREVYIKGPGMIFKGNSSNYITEIQILIE